MKILNAINIILLSLASVFIISCSSRVKSPAVNSEEGMVYFSPRNTNGINVKVNLYKRIDETTGLPLTAREFTLENKAKIYATVDLLNRNNNHKNLMFHFDWIDPEGNSFFRKRFDIPLEDTSSELNSAISIQPGKRDTGNYKLRVYLFRELIAEKKFLLASYNVDSAHIFSGSDSGKIYANILLGSKYNKGKEIPGDTGNVFQIKPKAKIYANINLINKNLHKGHPFIIDIKWCDSSDSPFFDKRTSLSPFDNTSEIRSSISIGNKSKKPGKYIIKVNLYDNLIGEKIFELRPDKQKEVKSRDVKDIKAEIITCAGFSKKNKKARGISDYFAIKNKSKIYAVIYLTDRRKKKDNLSKISVEWVGPDNKSFYTKTFKMNLKKVSSTISSSISVSDKRVPGEYKCRVYYYSTLISEKIFHLNSPSR
jgi:hypothetical protein